MLIPLRSSELQRLIPGVATGNQFRTALGSPQKILQRLIVSSIGGIITLLISQSQISSQFYSFWLLIGVSFLLYILWGPILEASRRNSRLRSYPFAALLNGQISNIYVREKIEGRHEQANKKGALEIIENRRTWMFIEIEDEDGYIGEVIFPMEKVHQTIKIGNRILCIALSENRDFSIISALSDAWIPSLNIWAGEYPFLLRPAFLEICRMRFQ